MTGTDPGIVLCDLAHEVLHRAIVDGVRELPRLGAVPAWARRSGASFVTLTGDDGLLGCIGSLEARRPLAHDVAANALAAAFDDPRFPPLTAAQFVGLAIEVSVLGPLEAVAVDDLESARSSLDPRYGYVVTVGRARGTLLPDVWSSLPRPDEFLDVLLRKAGLPAGRWPRGARLSRYRTEVYVRPPPATTGPAVPTDPSTPS